MRHTLKHRVLALGLALLMVLSVAPTSFFEMGVAKAANQYTVLYSLQGKGYFTGMNPSDCRNDFKFTVSEGDLIPNKTNVAGEEGYVFKGWYTDPEREYVISVDTETSSSKDITISTEDGTTKYSDNVVSAEINKDFVTVYMDGSAETGVIKENYLYDFSKPVTESMTLYAHYEKQTKDYTVKFNMGGHGEQVDGQNVEEGGYAEKPADPSEIGWKFLGWVDNDAKTFDFATTKITANTTVYAKWEQEKCTVKYDADGGNFKSGNELEVVWVNEKAQHVPVVTKAGYAFLGWFTKDGEKVDFNTTVFTEDTTLVAHWKGDSYNVTFVTGKESEGVAVEGQIIERFGFVTKPEAPTAKGQVFLGWFADKDYAKVFDFATAKITEPTTIYAKWEDDACRVEFDPNGGEFVVGSEKYVTVNAGELVQAQSVTKADHAFLGWFTKDGEEFAFNTTKITANITLVAHWKADSYNVTFVTGKEADGVAVEGQIVERNGFVTKPADPAVEGDVFVGWYADEERTQVFDFATKKITKATTVYAKWAADICKVEFDANGGQLIDGSTKVQEVKVGGYATPASVEYVGYDFLGWFTKSGEKFDFNTTKITSNITLVAHWDNDTLPVTFNMNGHGAQVAGQNVAFGGYATQPETPVVEGFEFLGWYKDLELTKPFDFTTMKITKPTVVYVGWKPIKCTVEFNCNPNTSEPIVQEMPYGGKAYDPAEKNPKKEGYVFDGWYTEPEGGELFEFNTEIIKEDKTLYAHWVAKSYPVTFDMNGHGVQVAGQNVSYGEYAQMPEDPAAEGWTFLGWFANEDLTKVFDFATVKITKATTVYAGWEKNAEAFDNQYVVTFDAEGGTIEGHAGTIRVVNTEAGQSYVENPGKAVREGYEFLGWFTEEGDKWNFANGKVTSDMTLYAHWNAENCVVKFDMNGHGKQISGQNVPYGGYVSEPEEPTAEGYAFVGWYKDENWFDFAVEKVTGNMTLVAKWMELDYSVLFYDVTSNYKNTPIASMIIQDGKSFNDADIHGNTSISVLNKMLYDNGYTMNSGTNSHYVYSKPGYKFLGWYTDKACTEEWDWQNYKVTENAKIYGKWEPLSYEMQFMRGNEEAKAPSSYTDKLFGKGSHHQTFTFDVNSTLDLNEYELVGYRFKDWALVKDFHAEKYDGYVYDDDTVVRFEDGACVNTTINSLDKNIIGGGEIIEAYLSGELSEYVFVAEWEPISYVVEYDKNAADATGNMPAEGKTYNAKSKAEAPHGNAFEISANKFVRKGYHFVGWNTEADGSGKMILGEEIAKDANHTVADPSEHPCTIYNGFEVLGVEQHGLFNRVTDNNLTTENGARVTLYAQWEECENYLYTVTVWREGHGPEEAEFNGKTYYATIELKKGTTGATVSEKAPKGFELDPVNSTKDLTITLDPSNYKDYCDQTKEIAYANIDVVEKAMPEFTAPPLNWDRVYNGEDQVILHEGKTKDGTVYYCVNPKTLETEKWVWTTDIPTGKDAGEYMIYSYIKGDETHKDSPIIPVGVSVIEKKEIGIDWGKTTFAFDGLKHIPSATATGLVAGDKCDITVETPQTYTGTYTATATTLSNANYKLPADHSVKFNIVNHVLLAKATPSGSKNVKVTWTGIGGAVRYEVYGINCGHYTKYKYQGLAGAGTKKMTIKKISGKALKAHKSYKFYVVAYDNNGKVIAKSNTMHCITSKTKGKKYANPKGIKANVATVTINASGINGVSAKTIMPKKKKHLGSDHVAAYRYLSGDTGIVTVDSIGTLRAVHPGTCYVYVQTVNGMWCTIRVIVQ